MKAQNHLLLWLLLVLVGLDIYNNLTFGYWIWFGFLKGY